VTHSAPEKIWQRALRDLRASDQRLADLVDRLEVAPITRNPPGNAFATLSRAIVGQQLSNRAAATIWSRVRAQLGEAVTPASWDRVDITTLRSCGLSSPKIRYIGDLAARFNSGSLQPALWPHLEDEALLGELTTVRGVGRWTAQMYMIFHEARLDVLAVDDAALRRAAARLTGREDSLSQDELSATAEPWRPWRSIASLYLWRSLDAPSAEGDWRG
jgi:DNA-3-methyladenine glycosylase II